MIFYFGKKRKTPSMEPSETLMIRGEQSFELNDQKNLIQIRIGDDQVVNKLKNM